MAILTIPEGYEIHKVQTTELTSLLSFAAAIIQELKVFTCIEPKGETPCGELQILFSDKSLSSLPFVVEQNRAAIYQIIEKLSKAGWNKDYQSGALLSFTPTDAVLL